MSNGSDGLGWVARLFSEVRGRDGQVFNSEPILPLLVSRILLNHQRALCVPACGTKEVVEGWVRCCWHNVHLYVSVPGGTGYLEIAEVMVRFDQRIRIRGVGIMLSLFPTP